LTLISAVEISEALLCGSMLVLWLDSREVASE
jgi:hypothetical protein